MDNAIAEYRQLKAELTRRPTSSEIEVKLAIIELILAEYGLEWKYVPGDGPDPGECVGYRVEIHPVSGWIDIGDEDTVCGCFPFHTSYTEIRKWCRVKEAELLASVPYWRAMKTRTSQQIRKREDDQLNACIKQGRAAYREGKPITANPYSSRSWQRCWELGWKREAEAQRIADEISMSSQPLIEAVG